VPLLGPNINPKTKERRKANSVMMKVRLDMRKIEERDIDLFVALLKLFKAILR
jgi:hypothetical protein